MKKELTTMLLSMFAAAVMAQETNGDNRLANIDWQEDSVEITTIKDIIRTQQAVTSRSATSAHFAKVWSKRGYFNAAYHTKATLTPQSPIPTGVSGYNGGQVPKFETNWGASIMAGKNIKLHKPIANTLQFNLDFTGVDLSVNHYNAENSGKFIYNSDANNRREVTNEDGSVDKYYYMHWNLEKYEISYGMNLGPSLTIAPFTHVSGANGLHFLKFNVYYHVGYNAAFMLMKGKIESDVQFALLPIGTSAYKNAKEELEQRNENQFVVGHGLYQTMGFNMTWKRIGFGFEHRWGALKYKNVAAKSEYGSDTYKFNASANRIYLTYRFGK